MRVLLDTNVILRATQQADPLYATARGCISQLLSQAFEPCLVPQVLYEYWVVATRAVANHGLGMTTNDAAQSLARLKSLFHVLRDERGILDHWERLVTSFDVQG